jgi:hypothetical protein
LMSLVINTPWLVRRGSALSAGSGAVTNDQQPDGHRRGKKI